jgi:hypothetical protein
VAIQCSETTFPSTDSSSQLNDTENLGSYDFYDVPFLRKLHSRHVWSRFRTLASAQVQTPDQTSVTNESWKSGLTVHLVGYDSVPQGNSGILEITPTDLVFVGDKGNGRIKRSQVMAAAEDDGRRETGGTAGKIIRIALPYGGGGLLGAFSQKQVSFSQSTIAICKAACIPQCSLCQKRMQLQLRNTCRWTGSLNRTPIISSAVESHLKLPEFQIFFGNPRTRTTSDSRCVVRNPVPNFPVVY